MHLLIILAMSSGIFSLAFTLILLGIGIIYYFSIKQLQLRHLEKRTHIRMFETVSIYSLLLKGE